MRTSHQFLRCYLFPTEFPCRFTPAFLAKATTVLVRPDIIKPKTQVTGLYNLTLPLPLYPFNYIFVTWFCCLFIFVLSPIASLKPYILGVLSVTLRPSGTFGWCKQKKQVEVTDWMARSMARLGTAPLHHFRKCKAFFFIQLLLSIAKK